MTATTSARRRNAQRAAASDPDSAAESQPSLEAIEREATRRQDLINSYLELSSLMYFGTPQPFSEILRDRQEPNDDQTKNAIDEAFIEGMHSAKTHSGSKKEEKGNSKDKMTAPIYTPLDVLLSAIREPEVIDSWSPHEVAVLIASVAKHGEQADRIVQHLPSKSVVEINQFLEEVYTRTRFRLAAE